MKNYARALLPSALLIASTFLLVATPVVNASTSYTVQVGYADNLRPTPFFPSPWCGDAGVALFAATGEPCIAGDTQFDDGAILITNTGTTSFVINDLNVNLHPAVGSPTFSIWGAYLPFTLNPGQSAIFAQTGDSESFDTSDSPLPLPVSDNPANNCSTGPQSTSTLCTTNAPEVTVTINGSPTSYFDNGHTLDTGGQDAVNYNPCINPADSPGNCNESLQWRDITLTCGTSCPGGGTSVPEFSLPTVAVVAISFLGVLLLGRRFQAKSGRVTGSTSIGRATRSP